MHIYTIVSRSQSNVNTMGAKLDFDPRVQEKAIFHQILIHFLLITEPGGFLIEVHSDPGTMESFLFLLLHCGLSLAQTIR